MGLFFRLLPQGTWVEAGLWGSSPPGCPTIFAAQLSSLPQRLNWPLPNASRQPFTGKLPGGPDSARSCLSFQVQAEDFE